MLCSSPASDYHLFPPHFSREIKSSIYFDCEGDEVVFGKLFMAGGLYVFIAWTQHAVQPKGQELTFSCVDFSKNRVGRDRSEKLLNFYFCSQTIIEDGSILMLTLQTLLQFRICAAQFLKAAAAAMKLWTWSAKWLSWRSGHYSVPW